MKIAGEQVSAWKVLGSLLLIPLGLIDAAVEFALHRAEVPHYNCTLNRKAKWLAHPSPGKETGSESEGK